MAVREQLTVEAEIDGDRAVVGRIAEIEEAQESASASSQQYRATAERTMRDVAESSEVAEQSLRDTAAAQDQVASSSTSMSTDVSSSANALGFELVQASQDAQFGLAGVANQIPLMAEQFGQLQQKTGSTTGAMSALLNALKGPAGIIGAVTLLVSLGPKLVSFFEDSEIAANEAGEAYQSAAESFFELQDVDLPENLSVEELRRQRERLQAAVARLQSRESELRRAAPGPGSGGTLVGEQAEELDRVTSRLERYETLLETVNSQLSERAQTLQLIEDAQGDLLRPVDEVTPGVETIEQGDVSFEQLQLEGFAQRLREAQEETDRLDNFVRGLGGGLDVAAFQQERFNEALQNLISRAERRVSLLRQLESFGLPQRALQGERLEAAGPEGADTGESLEERIRNVELATQSGRATVQGFAQSVEEASSSQDQVNEKLAQSIRLSAQLGATLAQAFQRGEVEANRLLGQLLTTIGSIVGISNPAIGAGIAGAGTIIGSFAEGGYTGSGGVRQVAGVVHRGEYVMPADVVNALGLDTMRRIHEAASVLPSRQSLEGRAGVPGYATGGLVGAVSGPGPRGDDETDGELLGEIRQLRDDIQKVGDRPVELFIGGRSARDIQREADRYEKRRNPRSTPQSQ